MLDFGAGWGENTRYLALRLNKGGKVIALDISPQWQKVAKRRLKEHSNVDFLNADVRSAGLPDASFDVVLINYVLHDIPRKERAAIVEELAKKLKPDGFIQLREPIGKRHGMPVAEIRSLMYANRLKESLAKSERKEFQARYGKV